MAPNQPDVETVVGNIINQDGGPIVRAGLDGKVSQATLDAAQDCMGALHEMIETGRQLERDLAELERRRDLIPVDGYHRLVGEAKKDARDKLTTAQAVADRSYQALEESLFEDALPRFAPEREQLARDEAHLAVSHGDPHEAAVDLAMNGNDEAFAALLSPWGKTLLKARGVRDVDKVLRDVRRVARGRIAARMDTTAAKLLQDHYGGLGAAVGSAGTKARNLGARGW